jgi:hypothetical protein
MLCQASFNVRIPTDIANTLRTIPLAFLLSAWWKAPFAAVVGPPMAIALDGVVRRYPKVPRLLLVVIGAGLGGLAMLVLSISEWLPYWPAALIPSGAIVAAVLPKSRPRVWVLILAGLVAAFFGLLSWGCYHNPCSCMICTD